MKHLFSVKVMLLILFFMGTHLTLSAQDKLVKGVVKVDDGSEAIGATVKEQGTSNGVVVDAKGEIDVDF